MVRREVDLCLRADVVDLGERRIVRRTLGEREGLDSRVERARLGVDVRVDEAREQHGGAWRRARSRHVEERPGCSPRATSGSGTLPSHAREQKNAAGDRRRSAPRTAM